MLQQSLSDLLHTFGYNKAGICAVIGVPKQWVVSMPTEKSIMASLTQEANCDMLLEEIVLQTGKTWLNLSDGLKVNVEFTEDEAITAQGQVYNYDVPFNVPHDDFTQRGVVFRAYKNREWILIVKQRTGAWRVIGSQERGAVFVRSFSAGTVMKGQSMNNCGFRWALGGRVAFYTLPFTALTHFRVSGNSVGVAVKLTINEPVYIVWNDGTTGFYYTETGTDKVITKTYATSTYNYDVYHRHQATKLAILGDIDFNADAEEITGTIPNTLTQITVASTQFEADLSAQFTAALTIASFGNNKLYDAQLESILFKLDTLGATGGLVNLASQTPAVTPTGDMITYKANLEAKGWTVLY